MSDAAFRAGLLAGVPSNYINGQFEAIAPDADSSSSTTHLVESRNPANPDQVVWSAQASPSAVHGAVTHARNALHEWSALALEGRRPFLERFQQATKERSEPLARLITMEVGKTLAESRLEVKGIMDKVSITLEESVVARTRDFAMVLETGKRGRCVFQPHGVMAVVGPFNFPAHLPCGQMIPALALGNTVVFKPSEKSPAVGQMLAQIADDAGFPRGVMQVVQGDGAIAASLVSRDDIDGVLFTGSWPVGRRILEANLDRPGRMVALELGGSNAAIICEDAHLKQAVVECVRASFATTGQRCTCTRRIIVHQAVAARFIPAFCKAASLLIVAPGDATEPVFMGPLISRAARDAVLRFQTERSRAGAAILVRASALDRAGHFVTPCVLQVEKFSRDIDEEVFGPVVQITVVENDNDAVEQANATHFGLAASVFTASEDRWQSIAPRVRCGCVNWNIGTAGANSRLPFGGLGRSGNHRPAAAFMGDSCAYPVARIEVADDSVTVPTGLHWDDRWIG
ncbi:MAG: aldehyde dehydrogenase family protein [Planctomycetota bacterium]|nr:aldehyde dehydrogenase family protein [Planctomycetota bacterium]